MKSNLIKKFLCLLVLPSCFITSLCGAAQNTSEYSVVRYVLDGDTLILENGEKVRLIGVDTPEIHDDDHRNEAHARRYGQDPRVVDEFAFKAKEFAQEAVLHQR